MPLFNRTAELIVGQSGGKGVAIRDLRFSFNIEKTSSETLNNSTLRIYNMNRTTRAMVETPNNALILKAGYTEDVGLKTIFVGIVRRSLTVREGTDWITELELDDGLISYQASKISATFSPGASGIDVLRAVASSFNLPVRPLPDGIPAKTYPAGFSALGRSREAMNKVCNYLGLEWSIQNQEVQILKKGGVAKRTAVLISANTGMIGSPAKEAKTLSDKAAAKRGITTNSAGVIKRNKENADGEIDERLEVQGYKVESMLQPTIEPGGLVKVESEGINGSFFRVERLSHVGDTGGGEWKTDLSLRFI